MKSKMTESLSYDAYISVDVEASGPAPGQYALLSIGACTLAEPRNTFYIELQPTGENFQQEAMQVHGLSLSELAQRGAAPAEAMQRFAVWLEGAVPGGVKPVFVSFNAAFDWMFVHDYFHRFLGYNPFGHAALDIKSFYMGLAGVSWEQTSLAFVSPRYLESQRLSHNALEDALDQACIFAKMLKERNTL
jgi:DNA polymerase III epsilon subunit-like protein